MEFAKESHYDINSILELLNSFNDTHALMNQQYVATWDFLGITEEIANQVINLLQNNVNKTVLISSLDCLHKFPQISAPWNEWLIYSIVLKWSRELTVGTTYNQFRLSAPLIAPVGKLDISEFAGVVTETTKEIYTIDNLDNIDDLIAEEIDIDLDMDEDWI